MFNSIFSISFQKIIHLTMINWLNFELSKINNNVLSTFSLNLNQPGLAINYLEYDNVHIDNIPLTYCRLLDKTNIGRTFRYHAINIHNIREYEPGNYYAYG